jgi:hypothetical protein
MACVLPFRPWFSPALRVFRTRTARDQSTDPSLVLSCTSVPPQWLSPKLVAFYKKLGRPCLPQKTPRFSPRPFSVSKQDSPFFRRARALRLKGIATPFKSPALRAWLPSRRRKPSCPREHSFSPPRSWASPSRALFRSRGALKISRKCSALAFPCQTLRPDTDASAVFAHETSCASSPRRLLRRQVEPLLSWASAPSGYSSAGY